MSTTAEASDPLTRAAVFAGQAPSLHNSQPWHWIVEPPDTLELRLEPGRVLRAVDPDARLAALSCGAALHHALLQLAADGWLVRVSRAGDADDRDLLARLRLHGQGPADHDAARLVRQVPHRHTDRREPTGTPLDLHRVHGVRQAVRRHGANLTVLGPRQIFALAEAAKTAQAIEATDPARRVEITRWIGGDPRLGTGIPVSALPANPFLLTAPARTLRRPGPTVIAESHHHAAVFAVLHSAGDDRVDWLTSGEALSAGWLTATALDVSVLPLSVVTEVAASRERLRPLLGRPGHPHLVLRLATNVAGAAPASTPRLEPVEFISYR